MGFPMAEEDGTSGLGQLWRGVRNWISSERGRVVGLAAVAMALAFALHAPSIGHGYCLVDDEYFVQGNPVVQGGLTREGIRAAWTTVQASYWAPLLWMSFMLDQELSGGAPWSFHLTNVFLFALTVGVLFALVRRWTGRNGIALATTLLWAFHPARVESVAWITERKDVLSGLFFLAGLWFYTVGRETKIAIATERDPPPPSAFGLPSSSLIFLSWLCMLLGGMAKPTILVMPVALLLLDVWPLNRADWNRFPRVGVRLAAEKWAFWLLAAGLASLPLWTHAAEQAIVEVTVRQRLAMIPLHYLFYLQKLVWPAGLAPLQDDLPWIGWQMGLGLGLLAGVTALVWRWRVRAPWALWGWLWFAGLLFPVSGLVWLGSERVAVRFLYLPQIGLTLAAVLAADAFGRGARGPGRRILCALLLLVLGDVTFRTLAHWRNPDSFGMWIWECHPQQGGACALGGDAHLARGEWEQAQKAYEQGVALGDKACFLRQGMVWNYLGHPERTAGAWKEFERRAGRSLEQFSEWERPQERELHWRVRGQVLRAQGNYAAAIAALKEAVRWEADSGAYVLAEYLRACHEAGRPEEGLEVAERMAAATGVRVREWRDLFPFYAQMWKMGARGFAYGYFADYATRFPEDAANLNYLAWLLSTPPPDGLAHARMEEWPRAAVRWAEQALKAGGESQAGVWNVLAAARANAGDSAGAVRAAEQARDLAREKGDDALAAELEKRILTYRMGLAWRE